MVDKLKKAIKDLQNVKEFKDFKKKNPKAYLASCVVIIDGKNVGDWQVAYYQPKNNKMTTFVIKDKVEVKGEDDIFQKEKVEIKELKLNGIKLSLNEMLKQIEDLRKKNHPGDFPNKIIVVLQNLDNRIIWNVTHLTSTLKIWNIKLDAKTDELIEEKIENVLSFKSS